MKVMSYVILFLDICKGFCKLQIKNLLEMRIYQKEQLYTWALVFDLSETHVHIQYLPSSRLDDKIPIGRKFDDSFVKCL